MPSKSEAPKKTDTSSKDTGGSRQIGSPGSRNGQVASSAGLGGGREDSRALGGNWEAQEFLLDTARSMGGTVGELPTYMNMIASQIGSMHQAKQTTIEDLPKDMLSELEPGTILRFAHGPEDMRALDLHGEHQAMAEVANVLTVNNPTPELMKELIQTGQFQDVVWAGHGAEDGMWITGEDGQAELMPAKAVAELFEDSEVQEVLLNTCNGAGHVDDELFKMNISTFGYDRVLQNEEAVQDATDFAKYGSLDSINQESGGWGAGGIHREVTLASRIYNNVSRSMEGWDFGFNVGSMNPFAGTMPDLSGLANFSMPDLSGLANFTGSQEPAAAPKKALKTPGTGFAYNDMRIPTANGPTTYSGGPRKGNHYIR